MNLRKILRYLFINLISYAFFVIYPSER